MGITSFSEDLIMQALLQKETISSVCELGAQNLYNRPSLPAPYAHELYQQLGVTEYHCIDLNGENGAWTYDLSESIPAEKQFDLVTDFGTSEHVRDLYACFRNVHNLCREGGIMIHENPKTSNWPGHGFHYFADSFYRELAYACGYEIIRLGSNPAMGNEEDGWNIHCLMRKVKEGSFIKKSAWESIYKDHVFTK